MRVLRAVSVLECLKTTALTTEEKKGSTGSLIPVRWRGTANYRWVFLEEYVQMKQISS
jgi:hypothetical protein